MASELRHITNPSDQRQRVAAWIALALALIYPLTVAFYAIVLLVRRTNVVTLVVSSLYNAPSYFEWPLPIIALFLAGLVLVNRREPRRVARAAIILSVLSLLAIAGVVLVLSITSHSQG